MKKIKALYDHLAVKNVKNAKKGKGMQLPFRNFKKRYPEYDRKDGKKHLLYIAPCLNGRGYYRAILPALELNQSNYGNTHRAIITAIPKWNFNKRFLDYVRPVDPRLIMWAHYIIFPAIDKDISYLVQGWKNQNKEVLFVMDLDENIHAMPRAHLQFSKIREEDKKQVLGNMAQMDLLTGASEGLLDYYEDLIEQYHPSSRVTMGYLPNLVSAYGYEELSPLKSLQKVGSSKIRIGIIGSGACSYDVCSILPVLKQLNKKYGDQVELVLFGWNGQLPGGKNRLAGVKFSFHKSVRFTDYFETLNQLTLDIGLLPIQKIPYNTHGKSFIKYLEFSVMGIPVIAANHSPYKEVIDQGETGFLAATFQEWMTAIDQLIAKEELRNQMGKNALKKAWSTYSYTRENLKRYQVIFR